MMKVRNLGRKSLEEVLAKLKELGLELSQGEEQAESNYYLINGNLAGKSDEYSKSTWLVSPKKHNHVSNGGKEKWQSIENLAEQQAKEKH